MISLRQNPLARWTALLLLSFAMFCSYVFMEVLSPLKDLLQTTRGWDSTAFGTMQGAETFLNVFVFFLVFAGIILDKMGVRFTALISGAVMLFGAGIMYFAVSEKFLGSAIENWFSHNLNYIPLFDELGVSPFYRSMPPSAKLASLAYMIFGCGVEMAGITVSRGIVKWFSGGEMALAMGSQVAIARLGVATCMIFSPFFAHLGGVPDVSRSVAFGAILLLIALILFLVYFFMDKKLDAQIGSENAADEPFRLSDIAQILRSVGFWLVATLCVIYYSAVFPFQKYAVNMLQCNLHFSPLEENSFWLSSEVTFWQYLVMLFVAGSAFAANFVNKKTWQISLTIFAVIGLISFCAIGYLRQEASAMFAVFPLLAVGITPALGRWLDKNGRAPSMLIFGSLLLVACHLIFAFILPALKEFQLFATCVAYLTILLLGASFSLVPAALWPSVPKLVPEKVIGSAYALIFWIQNIGLWLFPLLLGKILDKTNPEITSALNSGELTSAKAAVSYNYTWALLLLACLGVFSVVIGFLLKIWDKKQDLGLEKKK